MTEKLRLKKPVVALSLEIATSPEERLQLDLKTLVGIATKLSGLYEDGVLQGTFHMSFESDYQDLVGVKQNVNVTFNFTESEKK